MSEFYCFTCEDLIAPSTILPGMRCPVCGGRVRGIDQEYRREPRHSQEYDQEPVAEDDA